MSDDLKYESPALHEFKVKLSQEFVRLYAEIDKKNAIIQALTEERDEVVRLSNKLIAERDDARSLYCWVLEAHKAGDGKGEARKRGWHRGDR